jgi:hypothetical protein
MWLTKYSEIFAYQLAVSGFILASIFCTLFGLIQYNLWFNKSIL